MLDHLSHGEGFARAGDAQKHLVAVAVGYTPHELGNRFGLVAARFVVAGKLEFHVWTPSVRKMRAAETFYYTAFRKMAF